MILRPCCFYPLMFLMLVTSAITVEIMVKMANANTIKDYLLYFAISFFIPKRPMITPVPVNIAIHPV